MIFAYSDSEFIYELDPSQSLQCTPEKGSHFDVILQEKWREALDNGYFRYRLNITKSKVLEGKYSFLAQLNVDRATNRRQPERIAGMSQPFDGDAFNFLDVPTREVMFEVGRRGDRMAINVSPLEHGHSLLLPSVEARLPQVVTAESVRLAVETVLLSSSSALRVGFNSLCGFASVNHLHYHVYYLQHRMLLEYIKVEPLSGPCYQLLDYPAPAFVFQLSSDRSTETLARQVHRLTSYLQTSNVAHNLYFTRGVALDGSTQSESTYDTVRVYVWARTSSTGAKESSGFNPALCELFGHLNVKEESFYTDLTEARVAETLADISAEPFRNNRDNVIRLFQESEK